MKCRCENCTAKPCSVNVTMKLNVKLQQELDAERAVLDTAKDQIASLRNSNESMNKFLTMIAETIGTTIPKNAIEGINAADELAERIIELVKIAKQATA